MFELVHNAATCAIVWATSFACIRLNMTWEICKYKLQEILHAFRMFLNFMMSWRTLWKLSTFESSLNSTFYNCKWWTQLIVMIQGHRNDPESLQRQLNKGEWAKEFYTYTNLIMGGRQLCINITFVPIRCWSRPPLCPIVHVG